MKEELFASIAELISKDPERYHKVSGDDEALARFHERFPLESIREMALEDYCLGRGARAESFCWWIERGLQKALGRYMPGSSRGHLLYRKPDGSYYMHRKLEALGAEEALKVVTKITYAVASCQSLEEAEVVDDREKLAAKAEIGDVACVGGNARFLRLLAVYHPDWMLPINSTDHILHFLTQFSDDSESQLPATAIGAAKALRKIYDEFRAARDSDVTPRGFCTALYDPELDIIPPKRGTDPIDVVDVVTDPESDALIPLNQIFYGPPGTGKTYGMINAALSIIDPEVLVSSKKQANPRKVIKRRFDELVSSKRIGFVTFHQSFSYEDFVEGLKASVDEKTQQIRYDVEDGIFKRMSDDASAALRQASAGVESSVEVKDQQVWKMSLGNTLGADASIYDECIEKGIMLLGWGEDVDFTGVKDRAGIRERLLEHYDEVNNSDYMVTACNAFVNTMRKGDFVVVSDGNYKLRAIGEITGDYEFLPVVEDQDVFYQQCRKVKWHRTFSPSVSHDQLLTRGFSQATIYQLKPPVFDKDRMRELLSASPVSEDSKAKPYVLIIDEINRGNISRVFGELITLIEDSKRLGRQEALTVRLPYSKEEFSVPENLYLIGTMNTADRSLAQIDIALRRRFDFQELMPLSSMLNSIPSIEGIQVGKLLRKMNERIEALYDREHMIGHTFFLSLRDEPSIAELSRIFSGKILPLLEEYFFEDWEKIRLVLGDNRKPKELAMIRPKLTEAEFIKLFGEEIDHSFRPAYERNEDALGSPESYIAIYEDLSVSPSA
ncbi:AAA family ATPase [Verrucomicrobiales bacterium BCK34]|nr:AAA family ATPase [Verrucomicrobiales bacterium BCK34]